MAFFDFFRRRPTANSEMAERMEQLSRILFPNGQTDIDKDVRAVTSIFGAKLSREEATRFVIGSKALIYISEDESPKSVIPGLMRRAGRGVTVEETYKVYIYLRDSISSLSYAGGDGSTPENAVTILASTSLEGIPAEYAYLERRFGQMNHDFRIVERSHWSTSTGRVVEAFELELQDGIRRTVHFDITAFFGTF